MNQDRQPEDVSGECQLGEHGRCHGNVSLKGGAGPAVPLVHCGCSCHRGAVKVRRT